MRLDLTLREVVRAIGGTGVGPNLLDRVARGASIDSRAILPDQLFFALPGKNTDGHLFVGPALRAGACAAVISKPESRIGLSGPERDRTILVPDTLLALQAVARVVRQRFNGPVIAVTGSSGKTSTKDMITSVLNSRWQVLAPKGSFNNEIGLPLTLLSLEPSHSAVVLEMAMRGRGQIAELCRIALPTVGLVTNIGQAHLELLGSQEAIARAKGELLEGTDTRGFVVLNGDDKWCHDMANLYPGRIIWYGLESQVNVRGEVVNWGSSQSQIKVWTPSWEHQFTVGVPGLHNVYNALAAVAVAWAFGFGPEEIGPGLESVVLSPMRLQKVTGNSGVQIINDAYNANPDSVKAALQFLASLSGAYRIAVLGDMLELGPKEEEAHRACGRYAQEVGIDVLVGIGNRAKWITDEAVKAGMEPEKVVWMPTWQQASSFLQQFNRGNDIILVKASRAMELEKLVDSLAQ